MSEARDAAVAFEAIKVSCRQDKDGWKLTLAIHPEDIPDALIRTWVGKRYQVAMVELDDQDQPVKRPSRAKTDTLDKSDVDDMVLYAVMLCKEPLFQMWMVNHNYASEVSEAGAIKGMYSALMITSRAEIKENQDVRSKFLQLSKQYRQEVGIE